jgi:hypothetical protein
MPAKWSVLACAFVFAGFVDASAQTTVTQTPQAAYQWCATYAPCNYTSHFAIAAGMVVGAKELGLPRKVAAPLAVAFYTYREVRDDRRWPGNWGSRDSVLDIATAVAGAAVGYALPSKPRKGGAVSISAGAGHGAVVASVTIRKL